MQLLPMMMYCFAMSITPGPNNMMLTASGAHFGYRRTLPQILGIHAGGAVLALVCCLGLGRLFVEWPALQAVLRIAGALYLVVLAFRLARARMGEAAVLRPQSFAEGALFQVVNPKSWIKAVTLAAVFMPPGMPPLAAGALNRLCHAWADVDHRPRRCETAACSSPPITRARRPPAALPPPPA